jgi:hypothetical protein
MNSGLLQLSEAMSGWMTSAKAHKLALASTLTITSVAEKDVPAVLSEGKTPGRVTGALFELLMNSSQPA